MYSVVDYIWHVPKAVGTVLISGLPSHHQAEVMPVLWALLLATVVLTVLLHWRHAIGSIAIPAGIPVLPGGVPILGHAIPVLRNLHRLHDWLYEASKLMGEGKTYAFSIPLLPTSIMVTDPVCLEYLLKRKAHNFIKGPRFYLNFGPVLGHGIFTSDGDAWYWQRKLATHIFSVKSFKSYIDTVFGEKMNELTEVVGAAACSGSPLDLHDLMYRFTLDSFGQIGFGVDPGCLKTQGKVAFAAAFDSAQVIVNERFWIPAWPLLERLQGTGRVLCRDVTTIKAFALDIVQRRRKQLAAEEAAAAAAGGGGGVRDQGPVVSSSSSSSSGADVVSGGSDVAAGGEVARDLLSLFMTVRGPDGKPLSTQQLIDTVINFIIAGRDTTAQALSWTFYLLLQHPEVEQKLLQEIKEVLGPQALGGAGAVLRPSFNELKALRYARAVFMEAVRLYPSVPENCKYAVARDVLPDGTVIPAGSQVIYSPYVGNRMESFWGPDALTFRPDRWLEMDSTPTPYHYLTFNAGPRLCLGQRLAELEGVFVLTGLLARFRFRRAGPEVPISYTLSPTMPMKGGLSVVPELRQPEPTSS